MSSHNSLRDPYAGASQTANLTDWAEQPKQPRDFKKLFLIGGLAILSWVATYVGMLELIEANMGELPIVHKIIIGFSVAMLMTMIVWLLDQLFTPISLFTKICYAAGYVFLSIISVGFGFGFYWKVLESKGEGTRVAETAVSTVQAPLQTAATRLESLGRTLDSLQTTSAQKAEQERSAGTSCPNSKPGDGPRRKLREDDAARFAFARDVVKTRIESVKTDIASIEAELAKITKNDASIVDKHGTRNDFMKSLNRRLDSTVTSFNAFRGDPQLKQIRAELDDRAGKSQFLDTQGKTYACPDPSLVTMIRSVVASIDALPQLDKPKIATVEGSDATVEAFRRLTATFFGALSFKLPTSVEDLRELQKKAIATAEASPEKRAALQTAASSDQAGLSKRDYIPLSIAIFVDICLLLVSMGRPTNRLGNLVPKMQAAERGPVIQILSRFNEIHKDRQVRENFEIFRHVVFDLNGDYYVAVPLDAPPRMNPKDREDLRLEAQLLANLFTSFEKEKIFSRVLMPYISVKQIQKKLWQQGSKFAHAETFRLYKFKDGAWSEIILGAIMGAAKRVEAEKRMRRIEEDVFTRHEPQFAGPVSQAAARAVMSEPTAYQQPTSRAVPPPPAFQHRPQPAYPARQGQPDAPSMPTAATPSAAAFGPYAGAVAAQSSMFDDDLSRGAQPIRQANLSSPAYPNNVAAYPGPTPRRAPEPQPFPHHPMPTEDVVADLSAHRQRLEQQSEISLRVANNNTAPAELRTLVDGQPDAKPVEAESGMRVEAVERRMTFHIPTRELTMPASLQAMLAQTGAASTAPAQIEATAAAEVAITDHADSTAIQPWHIESVDDTSTIAGRFAPTATRS